MLPRTQPARQIALSEGRAAPRRAILQAAAIIGMTGLLGLLQGCATGPVFSDSLLPPLAPGQARIVLLRGNTLQGGGMAPQVRVNGQAVAGQLVGELVLGSYAIVSVPPGAVEVVLEPGGFTWAATYGTRKYAFTVQDQSTLYLRLQMATGTSGVVMGGKALPAGGFGFGPVSEKVAMDALTGLRQFSK